MLSPADIEGFRHLVESRNDREAKIWTMSDEVLENALGEFFVESADRSVAVLDFFANRRPHLLNYDFLVNKINKVIFVPTILMDTNIVNELHAYRIGDDAFRMSPRGVIVQKLVRQFIMWKCDYNPIFYHAESSAKSNDYYKFSLERAETMLLFHSMDEDEFIRTGRILKSQKAELHYFEKYGVDNISDAAKCRVDKMTPYKSMMHEPLILLSYCMLIKMALIRIKIESNKKRIDEFVRFCRQELGLVLGREILIAAFYFCGKADRLVRFSPGGPWGKVQHSLMASAWDLFLLRMPEMLLSWGDQRETVLAYVCTGDKVLRTVGKAFPIEQVACLPDSGYQPVSQFSYDPNTMSEFLPADIAEHLNSDKFASDLYGVKRTSVNADEVKTVADCLEVEIKTLCT